MCIRDSTHTLSPIVFIFSISVPIGGILPLPIIVVRNSVDSSEQDATSVETGRDLMRQQPCLEEENLWRVPPVEHFSRWRRSWTTVKMCLITRYLILKRPIVTCYASKCSHLMLYLLQRCQKLICRMTEGSRSATEIAFSPAPSRAEHNQGPLRLVTLVLLDHSKLETGVMFVPGHIWLRGWIFYRHWELRLSLIHISEPTRPN